jgi:ribonuclease-3
LDKHVIAQSSGTLAQKHIFGDALEAMIGAIYLDKGYNFVNRLLINELIGHNINLDELMTEETDFKSRLIEWCQKSRQPITFRTVHDENYSDNHPVFLSTVVIDGVDVGRGTGESKKQAEQRASASVWKVISDNDLGDQLLEEFDRFASGQ